MSGVMDLRIKEIMSVPGHVQFFKDVNPEADIISLFEISAKYTESGITLVDNPSTPADVVERLITDQINAEKPTRSGFRNAVALDKTDKFHNILPLAFHREFKFRCEVCPKKPRLKCKKCNVTFYCSHLHAKMDVLHDELCTRIKIIRNNTQILGSSFQRRRLFSQKLLLKERLINEMTHMAYKLKSQQVHGKAMACFYQCLQWMTPVYGDSIYCYPQTISIFTGIAQCQISLKDHKGALDSIRFARQISFKMEDWKERPYEMTLCLMQIKRARGLLHYEKKEYKEAVLELSEAIFYISECFHPTHIRTILAYLHLARVFIRQNKTVNGHALLQFSIRVLFDALLAKLRTQLPSSLHAHQRETMRVNMPAMLSHFAMTEVIDYMYQVREYVHRTDTSMKGYELLTCEAMVAMAQRKYNEARKWMRFITSQDINEVKGAHIFEACTTIINAIQFNSAR